MDEFDARAAALPKVLLHDHLDGGLRIPTLLALLQRRGLAPPVDVEVGGEAALAAWFDANAHAGSLEKYLEGFGLTVAAMADADALAQVAFEAAEDARAQGVLLAEFRIAPLLFEPYGLGGDTVVEALLDGLARSPLPSGLIVCAMRHLPPTETLRAARLALRWAGRSRGGRQVVGFDLAGAEFGHPPAEHREALALLRRAGLPMTLHAGEADAAERVIEAARLGARRIGHGVHLAQALAAPARGAKNDAKSDSTRAALLEEAQALDLHLEQCPTSNVQTGAAVSIAQHPIAALWSAGLNLGFNTDNTLISRITLNSEAAALLRETALTERDLLAMARGAAKASFLGASAREAALRRIELTKAALSTPAA